MRDYPKNNAHLRAPAKLVVLISGAGSNLQAILDHIAAGELRATVAAVISDRADAGGLTRAARAGVCTAVVAPAEYARPTDFHTALLQQVQHFQPDLVVLAGFMRILPASFVAKFARRIINIHPSLLPKFKGLHTHRRALAAGEKYHGASVHFVTPDLDAGPVIAQIKIKINADDTEATLSARVLREEHALYARAIQRVADGTTRPVVGVQKTSTRGAASVTSKP